MCTSCTESIPDQSKALEEWKCKMLMDDHSACLKRVCTSAEEAKDFVKVLLYIYCCVDIMYVCTWMDTHMYLETLKAAQST